MPAAKKTIGGGSKVPPAAKKTGDVTQAAKSKGASKGMASGMSKGGRKGTM